MQSQSRRRKAQIIRIREIMGLLEYAAGVCISEYETFCVTLIPISQMRLVRHREFISTNFILLLIREPRCFMLILY